jgi:hypothetical protein
MMFRSVAGEADIRLAWDTAAELTGRPWRTKFSTTR